MKLLLLKKSQRLLVLLLFFCLTINAEEGNLKSLILEEETCIETPINNTFGVPTVVSVQKFTGGQYNKEGDAFTITVTFNEAVTITGNPQLELELGATDRIVTRSSASSNSTLIFSYVVQAGDTSLDLDYTSINALTLNGGTIVSDSTGEAANLTLPAPGSANSLAGTSNIVIDTTDPSITSITAPVNGTYALGQNLDFTVNVNENVLVTTSGGTSAMAIVIGSTTKQATYLSGYGTTAIVYRYTVASGDSDSDGVAISSAPTLVTDNAGNGLNTTLNNVADMSEVLVDAVPPTISTAGPTSVTYNSATLGGNVSASPSTVTERGIVYSLNSTNSDPLIGGSGVTKDTNGTGTGVFSKAISSLTSGTTYAYKAYAINSNGGTSYGNKFVFAVKTLTVTNITECTASYTTPQGHVFTSSGSITEQNTGDSNYTTYNVTISFTANTQDNLTDETVNTSTAATYNATTKFSSYLEFKKSESRYVNVDVLQDDLAASNRSVFMWIKAPTNVTSTSQMLFAINQSNGDNLCNFQISTSEVLQVYDGSTSRSSSVTLNDGLWHHVGYTYNNTTNETVVYVNGASVLTFTNDQDATATSVYSLGQEYDNGSGSSLTPGNYYDGLMTEVSVWNEVLTVSDITPLMQNKIKNTHPKYANLVGYYGYSDCDTPATTLKDYSNAPANTGTLTHAAITKKDAFEELPNFNSVDWYTVSWLKSDVEFSTTASTSFIPDSGTKTYKLILTRDLISISDQWDITNNAVLSKNWTGATADWGTATNWAGNTLPIATDNVVIPNVGLHPIIASGTNAVANNITIDAAASLTINAGGSLTMDGNLTQNGTFTINSDATSNGSLIVKGTATGNVTYKRYLTTSGVAAEGWHLIGAPVNGQSINAFSSSLLTSASNNKSIAPYKNTVATTLRWDYYTTANIASAGNFVKAKGYSVKKATAGTLDFTGTLNINDAGETIAITDGGDDPAGNRWNLIANPYTAALYGSTPAHATNNFLKVNNDAGNLDPARGGLYLWNGTSYDTKSVDDAAFYIAPGQAFFVHAKDASSASASFTEAMQTHQTGNIFLRNATSYPEMMLKITQGSKNSSTKIRYIENKTTGLDAGSDVGTFTGTSTNFEVFTHLVSDSQGVNFAIQALPNTGYENMVVPVGVKAAADEEITFSINASNFSTDLKLFLEDRETNTFTRLDEDNSTYKITPTTTLNGIGRFYLHTTNTALNVDTVNLENISIYKTNANTLRIVGLKNSSNSALTIFTVFGKQVFNTSFISNGVKDITLPKIAKGVYLIQLQTDKGKLNKKIILE